MGLNSIGTGILEVCERLEGVEDQCFGLREVQEVKNEAEMDWYRKFWKSARGQNVSKTSALSQGGYKEVQRRLINFAKHFQNFIDDTLI